MSKLSKMNTKGMKKQGDSLGFSRLATDIYVATIKNAYITESQDEESESTSVTLIADLHDDPENESSTREYFERFILCNRDGDTFYVRGGEKIPLPGFTVMDDICQILTEQSITEQETETRKVKMRDRDSGQDIPTKVEVLVDIVGQEIAFGIEHRRENKREPDSKGNWNFSPEPVERNTIVKVFDAEDFSTLRELEDGKEPEFADKWLDKNQGVVKDRFKENVGGAKNGRPSRGGKASRNDGDDGDSGKSGRRGLSLGRKR